LKEEKKGRDPPSNLSRSTGRSRSTVWWPMQQDIKISLGYLFPRRFRMHHLHSIHIFNVSYSI